MLKSFFIHGDKDSEIDKRVLILNYVIVVSVVIGVLILSFSHLDYPLRWDLVLKYKNSLITGFIGTIEISLVSLGLSLGKYNIYKGIYIGCKGDKCQHLFHIRELHSLSSRISYSNYSNIYSNSKIGEKIQI